MSFGSNVCELRDLAPFKFLSERGDINFEFNIIVKASRLRQTANLNLHHVTKFPLYLLFTVHLSLYTTGKFYPKECF